MCTISWRREPEVLEVWFNRDEQRSRPIALPPRLHEGLVPSLAPQDPKAGGTWVIVYEQGRIGALLNFYQAMARFPHQDALRSRGALVCDLAQTSLEEDIEMLLKQNVETHTYAPFYFWTAGVNTSVSFWAWDGQRLEKRDLALPMHTTSSYRTEEVCAHRRDFFLKEVADAGNPSSQELKAFHEQGKRDGDAWSVHMSRDDARTVSTSHILLQDGSATYTYSTPDTSERHQLQLPLQG